MSILSELNSIDLYKWRRFHWVIAHSGQIVLGVISAYGSISSSWKYSSSETSFIVAAVILSSAAACGVVGLILKNDNPAHSSVPGAANATAS